MLRQTLATLVAAAVSVFAVGASAPAFAKELGYTVEVSDVTAKVGEPATMRATLKIHDGFRILTAYNNRMFKLSSFDDGVAFDNDMVRAEVKDDALVFTVGLHATKPGKHPINGLFRVGFIHDPGEMSMVSVPLIANVIGTE